MKCPKCNGKLYTIDSRHSDIEVKRRRQCSECKFKFNTYERLPFELQSTQTSNIWSSACGEIVIPNRSVTYAITNESINYSN